MNVRKSLRQKAFTMRYQLWRMQHKQPILEQPIFLIGCPRSGTTVTVELFGKHPDVANWSEAGLIWDPKHFFDPEADHCWETERVTEAETRRLHARFEHFRQSRGKDRFINKHPRCSLRIDFINKIFPDAYFIHLVRDGRAVVNSILNKTQKEKFRHTVPFGHFCKPPDWRQFLRDDPVEQAAHQWAEILKYVFAKKESLGARYMELKYEDLCQDTCGHFAKMFQFANLPVNESILARIPETLKDMGYKWKNDLTTVQIETINSVQKDMLKKLGYL